MAPRIEFMEQVTDQEAGAIRSKASGYLRASSLQLLTAGSAEARPYLSSRRSESHEKSIGCITFEGRVPTRWGECRHVWQVSGTEWPAPPTSVSGGSVQCLGWNQDRKTRAHAHTCTHSDTPAVRPPHLAPGEPAPTPSRCLRAAFLPGGARVVRWDRWECVHSSAVAHPGKHGVERN